MAVLNWGKCDVYFAPSEDGAPSGDWTILDTPKEDTTELTTSAGTEQTATEEGGAVVDKLFGKNTYELDFDLFVKKGFTPPFEEEDGVIQGEWAFRVEPQDKDCYGIQIDRATIRVEHAYTTADGSTLHYVVSPLKPAEDNTIKYYVPSAEAEPASVKTLSATETAKTAAKTASSKTSE